MGNHSRFIYLLCIYWFKYRAPSLLNLDRWISILSHREKRWYTWITPRDKEKNHIVGKTIVTFEDIGGLERTKQELKEALDFLIHSEEMKEYGIRPLKGILMDGPPGTGKTLLAKAAADYTGSVFVASSGSEFIEMYVGVGAQRVRDLFKEAKTLAKKQQKIVRSFLLMKLM